MTANSQARLIEGIMDDLRKVFKAINDRSKLAEQTTGLTGPQLWALKVLAEHTPIRISDLAARMYLHSSTVIGILDRLKAKQLVTRRRSSLDRRVVQVDLTAAGRDLVARMPAVAQEMLLSGLETLSARDLHTVSRGLKIQARLLQAEGLPAQLLLSQEINIPRRRQAVTNPTATRRTVARRPSPGRNLR
jgi:DNA-binding MarR family transcriptional regulator